MTEYSPSEIPARRPDKLGRNLKEQITKKVVAVLPQLVGAIALAGCASEGTPPPKVSTATFTPATPTIPVTPDKIQQSDTYTYYADPSAKVSYNSQGVATEVGKVYQSGSRSVEVFLDEKTSKKRVFSLWYLKSGIPFLTIRLNTLMIKMAI